MEGGSLVDCRPVPPKEFPWAEAAAFASELALAELTCQHLIVTSSY